MMDSAVQPHRFKTPEKNENTAIFREMYKDFATFLLEKYHTDFMIILYIQTLVSQF